MTTTVHTSNQLDRLIEPLCDLITGPSCSPFTAMPVVVHSQGLARHLTMRIADRLGICANVDFVRPEALAGRLLETALGPDSDCNPSFVSLHRRCGQQLCTSRLARNFQGGGAGESGGAGCR